LLPGFDNIVEERIKAAQKRGDFENLPGSGKPLMLEEDRHIAQELRLAHKILRNADCLPPEIELKKEIQRMEDLICGMQDTIEKYRSIKKLNFLIMKLNTIRKTSMRCEEPQQYSARLVERLEQSRLTANKNSK
jgi:hypothetical protein